MIIFRTSGGRLGNQIFQIFYALSIRRRDEAIYITDIREFSRVFETPRNVFDIFDWNRPWSRLFKFGVLELAAKLRLVSFIDESCSSDYATVTVGKRRGLLPLTFVRNGWFQDYRNLGSVGEFPLRFKPALQDEAVRWHERRRIDGLPAYFCHIRRTDYSTHLGGVTLPLEFYLRALRILRPVPEKALLLIATDDMEFARLAFKDVSNIRFVDEGPELTLAVLSLCDGGVISNSTFAWWAGYAVAQRGGRVIGPRNFLGWRTGRETPPGIATPDFEWVDVLPENRAS